MIVEKGWRVVSITFTLNYINEQAVVHVMQAGAKTYSIVIEMDHYITFGWNEIAKAAADF